MKYCVLYNKDFKYFQKVDEVIVPFNQSMDFFKRLIDRKRIHQNRIILSIEDSAEFYENQDIYIPILEELKEKHNLNCAVRFDLYSQKFVDLYATFREKELPFFFRTYVRDWEVFHGLIGVGVSDLYIVESLAFELNLLGPVARAKGISIRVFANVCQSSWSDSDSLKSFFIRPEDVDIYDPYVDVIEFFEGDIPMNTLFKIYAIDKKWFGDLSMIITGLEESLDSRRVLPHFALTRVKCGKRCLKGNPCKLCERVVSAAKVFEENNLILKRDAVFEDLEE